jgi:hypothetical protein
MDDPSLNPKREDLFRKLCEKDKEIEDKLNKVDRGVKRLREMALQTEKEIPSVFIITDDQNFHYEQKNKKCIII